MDYYELLILDENMWSLDYDKYIFTNLKEIWKHIKVENLNLEIILNYEKYSKIKIKNIEEPIIINQNYLNKDDYIILNYTEEIKIKKNLNDDKYFYIKILKWDEFNKYTETKNILEEDFVCCICLDICFNYVQFNNCSHFGCGLCISLFVKSKIEDEYFEELECPICKENINIVFRNNNINKLINVYFNKYDNLEYQKQKYDDYFNYNNILELENLDKFTNFYLNQCIECRDPREDDGFQCSEDQNHFNCSSCNRVFPDREDCTQECNLCLKKFCNWYLGNCNGLIKFMNIFDLFQLEKNNFNIDGNIYETDILVNLKNKLLLDLENILKLFIEENNQLKIQNKTFNLPNYEETFTDYEVYNILSICSNCFESIKIIILIWFKQKYFNELPDEEKIKMDCWYGKNCRTMTHRLEHRERLNHLCFQKK